ncbi:unnamed protein product [Linum tenue]|uniref:Neprosin PEP catalytic domain-containing protein n=1 Tax=Linum tenue TaxID=586396 RepID=A0AAV0I3C8_9ROSI|nr:unnamed protein product [Linum tenue]
MPSKSWIVILLLSSLHLALGVSNGGIIDDTLLIDPTSILKTISEVGEIIDCVDIYKQPAFSHPRLRNHTLQMEPSSYPIGLEPKSTFPSNSSSEVNIQSWHKKGEYCPEGSIPILRSLDEDFPKKHTHPLASTTNNSLAPPGFKAEYAVAFLPGSNFYGALGEINVWNPKTLKKELSASQFWVTDGGGKDIDSVEVGWMVTAFTNHPTIFVYWTADGYNTGCYNVRCSGFVQTNRKIALGAFLTPISIYGGEQHLMGIKVYRDGQGNWWVNVLGQNLGYWPPNLFNGGLRGPASLIEWGGEVINSNPQGVHTSTQMGSGHFPSESYSRAAYFKNLQYIVDGGGLEDAKDITGQATRPECYDIQVQKPSREWGSYFYYGGPGLSANCK